LSKLEAILFADRTLVGFHPSMSVKKPNLDLPAGGNDNSRRLEEAVSVWRL